jgi:hypothetical protein
MEIAPLVVVTSPIIYAGTELRVKRGSPYHSLEEVRMIKYLILAFTLFLSSCAATGPIYQHHELSSKNNGGLYILRESKFVGSGNNSVITINNVKYTLKSGGYIFVELPVGEHVVFQKSVSLINTVKVNIKSNTNTYLQYDPAVDGTDYIGVLVPHLSVGFGEVPEKDALKILPKLKLVNP